MEKQTSTGATEKRRRASACLLPSALPSVRSRNEDAGSGHRGKTRTQRTQRTRAFRKQRISGDSPRRECRCAPHIRVSAKAQRELLERLDIRMRREIWESYQISLTTLVGGTARHNTQGAINRDHSRGDGRSKSDG